MTYIAALTDEFTDLRRLHELAPADRFVEWRPNRSLPDASDVEVAIGGPSPTELRALIAAAPRLRWFACVAAGVERLMDAGLASVPGLVITRNSGPQDIPVAEHALALMLAAAKRLREYGHAQDSARWIEAFPSAELDGATVVVYGLGSIGRHVAKLATSLGMHVIGVRRSPTGGATGVVEMVVPAQLADVIGRADYLVITAPLTRATMGAISADLLDRMQATAWVVNVSRGAIVDERALRDRLQTGRLGGAALDVFAAEPLSSESPFWKMQNVILTPHAASSSRAAGERTMRLFIENLGRWKRGEPLVNVVNAELGY